jgi:hypothetical protein
MSDRRSILLPEKSIADVAANMGISVAEATRLERSALLKMRDAFERDGLTFRELLAMIAEESTADQCPSQLP